MAGNEDQPVNKDVTLTVGTGDNTVSGTVQNEQTWDEAWAQKFNENFKNAEGKVTISTGNGSDKITISKGTDDKTSGKLTNKLSSLTLNVGLDVAEGGTFVNNGTLEANKAITVTGSLVNTGTLKIKDNLTINGGFDNAKGTIEVTGTDANNKANMRINSLNKTDDLEAAPASVVMGDITLKNATLTNNDKGYKLKTEADKKKGEDDKTPETRARVSYGNVTLKTAASSSTPKALLTAAPSSPSPRMLVPARPRSTASPPGAPSTPRRKRPSPSATRVPSPPTTSSTAMTPATPPRSATSFP